MCITFRWQGGIGQVAKELGFGQDISLNDFLDFKRGRTIADYLGTIMSLIAYSILFVDVICLAFLKYKITVFFCCILFLILTAKILKLKIDTASRFSSFCMKEIQNC